MAKPKQPSGVPNRLIYSRASFLYQAASHLAARREKSREECLEESRDGTAANARPQDTNMSRRLLADLRSVTLKAQIRSSPNIKYTVCKYCDTLLVDGESCTTIVENKSKGGRKSWADVMVRECHTCGREKRMPVNVPRQKRRPFREAQKTPNAGPVAVET